MIIVVLQLLCRVRLFATPWTAAHQHTLSITNSQSLLKLMSIKSVMPFNLLILCCPLLLPSIFPSIRVFYNKSVLRIRWPTCRSFSISPSNEYSGLIAYRIDWFDLLAVQGTLKGLLQHHNSKEIVIRRQKTNRIHKGTLYLYFLKDSQVIKEMCISITWGILLKCRYLFNRSWDEACHSAFLTRNRVQII